MWEPVVTWRYLHQPCWVSHRPAALCSPGPAPPAVRREAPSASLSLSVPCECLGEAKGDWSLEGANPKEGVFPSNETTTFMELKTADGSPGGRARQCHPREIRKGHKAKGLEGIKSQHNVQDSTSYLCPTFAVTSDEPRRGRHPFFLTSLGFITTT